MKTNRQFRKSVKRRGIAILAAMIFIAIFSAFSVGMLSLASGNLQISDNHSKSNTALNAALSGLECARYIAAKSVKNNPIHTGYNYVSVDEANTIWGNLCSQLQADPLGGLSVAGESRLESGNGDQIVTQFIPYEDTGASFRIRFYRYDDDPVTIHLQCTGQDGGLDRTVQMDLRVTKDAQVLNYALAGRGRMWLAGDTTIHGDIYSSWNVANISPFNMTDDSTVEGSLNTVLPWQNLLSKNYHMQSFVSEDGGDNSKNVMLNDNQFVNNKTGNLLNADGQVVTNSSGTPLNVLGLNFQTVEGKYNIALDSSGNPVQGYVNGSPIGPVTYGNPVEAFDGDGNRIYGTGDQLQGTYETVNYSQPDQTNIPALSISDYDTSKYKSAIPDTEVSAAGSIIQNGTLYPSGVNTVIEYFPHAAGSYTTRASNSSLPLKRHIYENKTIRNVVIREGTNALFRNCTFEDVLYIDSNYSGPSVSLPSSYTSSAINSFLSTPKNYNNIRFENCTFNGTIITNTPQALNTRWWVGNNLYFTGEATFNNTSYDATILAPHFNVNLGNTNPNQSENNVLTGAIVGGIVDVRGNAQIYGTIISMADTTIYTSGYVTNIGATENDGGSETTEAGDIGVIEITPNEEQMLPSGITTPIILKPLKNTYVEKI